MVCMYHIFFIHSSVDEHLGCFHVLTILNSTAKIIEEHVSFMKMNFAKHQRIEPSCQENQLWIEDRNLVSFLDFQGGERGIEVESITKWVNHASTKKKKKRRSSESFHWGRPRTFLCAIILVPSFIWTESPFVRTSSHVSLHLTLHIVCIKAVV